MSSLNMRGIDRSAIGEPALLGDPNASRSREYREPTGDEGAIFGDAALGGEDCILLESIFG